MRKFVATILLATTGVCAASYLRDYSLPRAYAADAADIPFDDPAHRNFFNHQKFLTQRGENGITPENWQKMSREDRLQALAKDEAYLAEKYKEFQATPALVESDRALFQAVWGEPKSAVTIGGVVRRGMPQPGAAHKNLAELSKKIERSEGTLDALYDAAKRRQDLVEAPVAAGRSGVSSAQKESPPVIPARNGRARGPAMTVPPPAKDDGPSGGQDIPWVLIAVSAMGGLTALVWKLSKSAAQASVDHFDLDIRVGPSEGTPGHKQSEITDKSCGPSCINTCASTCDSTCSDTCFNTCGGGTCGGTCAAPTCAATCGDTCRATCEGTCSFTCRDTCPMTCNLPRTNYTCPATCGC